jgi:hypothetical protein
MKFGTFRAEKAIFGEYLPYTHLISLSFLFFTLDIPSCASCFWKTYLPTIHSLLAAIIANKTASGQARLLRQEQIVAVPNDRGTRNQCLNNNSFIAAVDPLMMAGGCGFGTTDCRFVDVITFPNIILDVR